MAPFKLFKNSGLAKFFYYRLAIPPLDIIRLRSTSTTL